MNITKIDVSQPIYAFVKNSIIFIIFAYIFTAIINFFSPITSTSALVILILTFLSVYLLKKKIEFNIFRLSGKLELPVVLVIVGLLIFTIWAMLVIFRPTTDCDANIYHLPLSILINHSSWYPGIGKLSTHFGFANGNSLLSSLFTSFRVVGFENIVNLFIWVIFGLGIFLFLIKKEVKVLTSGAIALTFIITSDMFWQSYNMGTDLPQACFIVFGLLALSQRNFKESILFFSLAALFKTFGLIALIITSFYLFIQIILRKKKPIWRNEYVYLSLILFVLLLLRSFIATGNPIYPIGPLNLATWGIDIIAQRNLFHTSISRYAGVERSLTGLWDFVKALLFYPNKYKSSWWFSPLFLSTLLVFLANLRQFSKPKIRLHSLFMISLVTTLLIIWFMGSPLVRFIYGVLVYITITLFLLCYRQSNLFYRLTVNLSLVFTLVVFSANVFRHLNQHVLNFLAAPMQKVYTSLRFSESSFKESILQDNFSYWQTDTPYCFRKKPPCIGSRSLGVTEELIKSYRRYNQI